MTKLKNISVIRKITAFIQRNSTEIFCVVCFVLANISALLYLSPFNRPIIGHDYKFHYLHVEAVKYNIQNHNLFSGIDYLYFGGGGYAGSAYPDIFLYIPGILRVLGVGIGESMVVFLIICNVFSYCFMYSFLSKISGSSICATMGAFLYIVSTYRIDNIVTRFALGEVQALVFWPLILYGLYDFIFDDFKKPYLLGFGFVGMLLSHTISTTMALGLVVVLSLVYIKRIMKTPKKLITLSITAGCAVIVTSFYWMPLLELLSSCEMSVKVPAFHTKDNAILFEELFLDSRANGIAGMKLPIFLALIPRVFLSRKSPIYKAYLQDENKNDKVILIVADAFMDAGIILTIMSTRIVPWTILSKFLDFIQFPWRFFGPASTLLIIAGTIYIFYIAKYTEAAKTAGVIIMATAFLIAVVHSGVSGKGHADVYAVDYYSDVNQTYSIGMGEWLPRAAQGEGIKTLREMGDNVILSNDRKISCKRDKGTLEFELTEEGADSAVLPYIWYKGYSAADEHGNELDITMSDNGLVQVDLRGASGRITVQHTATTIRIVSYIISAVSVITLIVLSIILYGKRKLRTSLPRQLNHDTNMQ